MEEKPIRIIVDYNNQRFTFTMPQIAEVAMWSEAVSDIGMETIHIEASYSGGIDAKREELTE